MQIGKLKEFYPLLLYYIIFVVLIVQGTQYQQLLRTVEENSRIRQTSLNILAITVTNPCQRELTKEGGCYRSTKREGYGQGLKSEDMIVNKYQGMMEILTDLQIFTVKILLQISDGKVV